jgi:hypothetical protein
MFTEAGGGVGALVSGCGPDEPRSWRGEGGAAPIILLFGGRTGSFIGRAIDCDFGGPDGRSRSLAGGPCMCAGCCGGRAACCWWGVNAVGVL